MCGVIEVETKNFKQLVQMLTGQGDNDIGYEEGSSSGSDKEMFHRLHRILQLLL